MYARALLPVLIALSLTSCGGERPAGGSDELSIAAAASLRPAVDAIIDDWNRTNTGRPARVSYGASGILYAQIDSRAPFDVFLSADDLYPRRLHERGLASKPFRYATGRLVVWVPTRVGRFGSIDELATARFRKIAIANPNLAPYGEAALEALERAGVYDGVKGRLLFASNASEAAHYAESGGAEAALLPVSLVTATRLESRGSHILIPSELHDPIVHEGVIITVENSRRVDAAQFVEHLVGPEGRAVLERFGFETTTSNEAGTPMEP